MTPVVEGEHTFIEGMVTFSGAGGPATRSGIRIYHYTANKSMVNESFYNSDGDFLIVPQNGDLDIQTELGFMEVRPGEICVIPRGINFAVGVEKLSRLVVSVKGELFYFILFLFFLFFIFP